MITFPGVPRLTNLCIQQAKTRLLTTELLLCLPQEVLGELCGTPASQNGSCIVLINDTPLQADANMISGVICGFHVFRREFLFGEYETNVFQDSLESASWGSSVPLKDIVPVIGDSYKTAQEDQLNKTNCNPNPKHLTVQNGKEIEALLYQQVARWVLKQNGYFSLKISAEFLKLAQKETIKVRMVIH